MLKLEPSRIVVVLFAIAFLLAVVGCVISALSLSQLLFTVLLAFLLMLVGVQRYWSQQRGVLYFGESGWAWQPEGEAIRPVQLKKAVGWSDWFLQVTLVPSSGRGLLAHQLFILPDNCHSSQRRHLRAFLLSHKFESL